MASNTLPHWLIHHAETQARRIALRHKQQSVWHEQSWKALQTEIVKLVDALAGLGFGVGDTLVLLTHPRREALLLSLAAQWLGGVAAPIDPSLESETLSLLLDHLKPGFVFAEAQQQVEQAQANSRANAQIIHAEPLPGYASARVQHYQRLLDQARPASRAPLAEAEHSAFALYRLNSLRQVQVEHFRHEELVKEGRQLVFTERLGRHEQALAARVFATSGYLRYVLAPWLTAGFTLNFPQSIDTRDDDRRELKPTLVAGTRDTYERLEGLIRAQLPLPDSLAGRLVTYALRPDGTVLQRFLGYWLVKRRLRNVIGFSHIRVPLLIGPALPQESLQFFRSLDIHIHTWDKVANWRTLATMTYKQVPATAATPDSEIKRAS